MKIQLIVITKDKSVNSFAKGYHAYKDLLPVTQPTIWFFEFFNTQCFSEFQGFLFYYKTIYW